jgi:hypothetical protein
MDPTPASFSILRLEEQGVNGVMQSEKLKVCAVRKYQPIVVRKHRVNFFI